ncbi:MAG: RHS repeat-associated core domain-containing protein [Opitutales bacterium]
MPSKASLTISSILLTLVSVAIGQTAFAADVPIHRVDNAVEARERLELLWVEPEIRRSKQAEGRLRIQPSGRFGVANRALSAQPSDKELQALAFFNEPLQPLSGESPAAETAALVAALKAYQEGQRSEDVSGFVEFIEAFPESRWLASLELNLGRIAYDTGYFSKALDFWFSAWERSRQAQSKVGVRIANLAIAEYALMNARIGRKDELERVFAMVEGREFQGNARIIIESAQEGHFAMVNEPGVAFRCGPYALTNIAPLLNPDSTGLISGFLERAKSPPSGFSLTEVQAMSSDLGLNLQMSKREVGASIIVPSVDHWKVGHYGALTRELNGYYLLVDPTFGNRTWMSAEAIDAESSGFFLAPAGSLPSGWSAARQSEAAKIYGRGHSGDGGTNETGNSDHQRGGDGCDDLAMATYSFHTLLASLRITDVPVGYPAARGPDVRVRVSYHQREEDQPATIDFTSFSPLWVSNWVSYLTDNPNIPGGDITLYQRGGGNETFTDFDPVTQTYGRDPQSQADLERLKANTYVKRYPNGSLEYYEHYIGTVGTQRKVFLTRVVDPAENTVKLDYDTTFPTRLRYIHDAIELTTEFFYDLPDEDYLVTSVEDPYGRTATFTYTSVNGELRLTDIEDVYGIISSFGYESNGDITSLTTPYGTTTFELSPVDLGRSSLIRYIEAIDPYGNRERIEYNLSSAQTGLPGFINDPLPDSSIVDFRRSDNDDRNSFFWDKRAMKQAEGDYSSAHLYHWVQPGNLDAASSILEREKPALQGRVWYNYPGQPQPYIQGDLASPSVIARVVEDESGVQVTQASLFEYNALGNVTRVTDPQGRETAIEYAANGIDIRFIRQKVGESGGQPIYETLATYTYNPADPPHRPETVTLASGSTTEFSYNSYGQVETVPDDLNQVVTFTYETNSANNGYDKLLSMTGDVPGGDVSFTYDSFDRVRTITDSEGHVITYDYDDLDRVTLVTFPDSSYQQFVYQDQSLVAVRDREGRRTHYFHDALRRVVAERNPAGEFIQYEWCSCDSLSAMIDASGNRTEWVRDVRGRVLSVIQPDGTAMHRTYYPLSGALQQITDALSQTTDYAYFVDGNLATIDYSDAGTPNLSMLYDQWYNRPTSMTDGIGTHSYAYHPNDGSTLGAGNLARVNGPFTDDTTKYTYDDLGRVRQMQIVDDATFTTASFSEEFVFDARSRLEQVINDLGTFDYTYIGQSNRIDTIAYPNGMTADYDYYTASGDFLLMQIQNLSSGTTPTVLSQFDYTYRQDRNIETWTVQQGGPAQTWTFGYDAEQQLQTAVRRNAAQTIIDRFRYGYDPAGNRNSVTSNGSTTNYAANNLNQLTTEQGFGPTLFSGTLNEPASVTVDGQTAQVTSDGGNAPYTFEALIDLQEGSNSVVVEATDGNNNTQTNTYVVTVGGVVRQLEYDLKGNLRFERDAQGAILREFRWDQLNRLLTIIDGSNETEFAYDGNDRRVRIIERTNSVVQSNHVYIWSGSGILQKRNAAGTSVERSYFSRGFIEGSAKYFCTKDHLGSTREVVANDGVTVESRYDYDPWGETTKIGGTGAESDFLYTGHFHHAGSGLYLAQYRAYDSELGRWLSRDPLGFIDGPNLYAYVGNRPTYSFDPDGRSAVSALATGWAGALAEPTPVGEVVMAGVTVGVGTYVVADAVTDFIGDLFYDRKAAAPRRRENSKKRAREAAEKRCPQGKKPVHHPHGRHGPHYHPVGRNGRPTHEHYYYPGTMLPPLPSLADDDGGSIVFPNTTSSSLY